MVLQLSQPSQGSMITLCSATYTCICAVCIFYSVAVAWIVGVISVKIALQLEKSKKNLVMIYL